MSNLLGTMLNSTSVKSSALNSKAKSIVSVLELCVVLTAKACQDFQSIFASFSDKWPSGLSWRPFR